MTKQKGFTLIEIGIVLFIIGILIAIFLPSYTQGIKDDARIKAMETTFIKYFSAMRVIQTDCNLSTLNSYSQTATGLLNTGIFISQFLSEGSNTSNLATYIRPAYQYCIKNVNIAPMSNLKGIYPASYMDELYFGANVGKNYITTQASTNYNGKDYLSMCFRDYNKSDLLKKLALKYDSAFSFFSGNNNYATSRNNYRFSWTDNTGATPFYQLCIYSFAD